MQPTLKKKLFSRKDGFYRIMFGYGKLSSSQTDGSDLYGMSGCDLQLQCYQRCNRLNPIFEMPYIFTTEHVLKFIFDMFILKEATVINVSSQTRKV